MLSELSTNESIILSDNAITIAIIISADGAYDGSDLFRYLGVQAAIHAMHYRLWKNAQVRLKQDTF